MASKPRGVGVVMLWALLSGSSRAQLKVGCNLEALRACGDDFVPYAKKTLRHSSGDELKETCENEKREITCGTNFVNDCMEGATKTVSLPVAKGYKKNTELACNVSSKEHEAYEKAVSCMNSAGTKLNACWKTLHEAVQKAVNKAPTNQVIFYTCCSFYDLVSCTDPLLAPCEGGARQTAFDSLFGMFIESQSLACGVYTQGSPACKALPKLPDLDATDRKIENYIELLAETAIAFGRANLTRQRTN
ncbi:hypothetical protein MTO96_025288 [Rhipicephalus appendiculatus]